MRQENGSGVEGSGVGLPHPTNIIGNYQIILNILEIDLKTSSTYSTTEGKEEATSKKVASAETRFGKEMDPGHCSGKGAVWHRMKDRLAHRGAHRKNKSPYQLAWKVRADEFHEFL